MKTRTYLILIAAALTQDPGLTRLRRAFRASTKTRDAFATRRKSLRALRGVDSAAAVRALFAAYEQLDQEIEPIQIERARVLEDGTSLELARFRKKLDPIHELQDEILARLHAMTSVEAADEMLGQLAEHARLASVNPLPTSLKLGVAHHLGRMRAIGVLRHAIERKLQPDDAIAFLRVIRSLGRRGSFFAKWTRARLADASPTVRLEAARTASVIGDRSAATKLIERLATETGRVQDAFVAALRKLTGQPFGASPRAWSAWLAKERGDAGKPAKSGGTVAATKEKEKRSSYFGIPQRGSSILYVFDRSDSMRHGGRIAKSRRELSKALGELPVETRFNIVAFSTGVTPWQTSLVQATPDNVKKARKWLRSLEVKAATSSYDALDRAFQLAGRGATDRFHELDVETIFFLSDGEPTRRTGGYTRPVERDSPRRILSAVRKLNALDRVVIHTIGLGIKRGDARAFLVGLAAQNGGRFVAVE